MRWSNPVIYGILFIAIGFLIWLSNFHIIHISWRRDWPVILIAIGIVELIKQLTRR